MTQVEIQVEASNESAWNDLDLDHWAQIVSDTLAGEGVRFGSLDLIFVDEDRIAELNAEHMGKSGPTDVLSFPMDEPGAEPDLIESGDGLIPVPLHLGDLVICPQVAERQAPDHCGQLEAELTLLVIHGVLHILGHDHAEEVESAAMVAREEVHMARCGFLHPGPVQA